MFKIFLIAIIVGLFSIPAVYAEESIIPEWIKNTAEFWINGQVSDEEFVTALQFLVEQGVLNIPQSESMMNYDNAVSITNSGDVLFTNVNIFDGVNDELQQKMNVLVKENKIAEISNSHIGTDQNTMIIDGKGKTLMPGLIDMHQHIIFNTPEGTNTFTHWDFGGAGALAGQAIRDERDYYN